MLQRRKFCRIKAPPTPRCGRADALRPSRNRKFGFPYQFRSSPQLSVRHNTEAETSVFHPFFDFFLNNITNPHKLVKFPLSLTFNAYPEGAAMKTEILLDNTSTPPTCTCIVKNLLLKGTRIFSLFFLKIFYTSIQPIAFVVAIEKHKF